MGCWSDCYMCYLYIQYMHTYIRVFCWTVGPGVSGGFLMVCSAEAFFERVIGPLLSDTSRVKYCSRKNMFDCAVEGTWS